MVHFTLCSVICYYMPDTPSCYLATPGTVIQLVKMTYQQQLLNCANFLCLEVVLNFSYTYVLKRRWLKEPLLLLRKYIVGWLISY